MLIELIKLYLFYVCRLPHFKYISMCKIPSTTLLKSSCHHMEHHIYPPTVDATLHSLSLSALFPLSLFLLFSCPKHLLPSLQYSTPYPSSSAAPSLSGVLHFNEMEVSLMSSMLSPMGSLVGAKGEIEKWEKWVLLVRWSAL